MKRYAQNAFIVFVLLCGLVLLFSCSTSRHVETVATVETRDTTHTRIIDDTITVTVDRRAELRDTAQKIGHITGSLKIERDTAGRPVLYVWDTSSLIQTEAVQEYEFNALSAGRGYARATDAATSRNEEIQKEEKKATKVGSSPADLIGPAIFLLVVLYVIYVIIENLWRNRKK